MYFRAFLFSRKRQDELRMPPSSVFDAGICLMGYDGTKRLGVRGVAKTPYVLDFFLG